MSSAPPPFASTRATSSATAASRPASRTRASLRTPTAASDLSESGAKRAERVVGGLFILSILGTLGFIVAYFAIDSESTMFIPGIGQANALHALLGVTMALSLLGIGFGAVHWAKTLMPDEEEVEMRHPMRSADEARTDFVQILGDGAESRPPHPSPDHQVRPRRGPRPLRGPGRPARARRSRPAPG